MIPIKEVKIFPNNKQWISKDIKGLIFKRINAFNEGDVNTERESKKEMRAERKKAKVRYKDKIEAEPSSNKLKTVWKGMKTMTGS